MIILTFILEKVTLASCALIVKTCIPKFEELHLFIDRVCYRYRYFLYVLIIFEYLSTCNLFNCSSSLLIPFQPDACNASDGLLLVAAGAELVVAVMQAALCCQASCKRCCCPQYSQVTASGS